MRDPLLFWLIICFVTATIIGPKLWRARKRQQALKTPFAENWLQIVKNNLPIYPNLPENLQQELQAHIKRFVFDKTFIGCAGLEVTEEMRITVAACACLLL